MAWLSIPHPVDILGHSRDSRLVRPAIPEAGGGFPTSGGAVAQRRSEKGAARTRRLGAPLLRANVAQLRALAHPLRLRLFELFAETPRTTMQVAELLGQPPTRLYHHVNALERAGLLKLRETRQIRGAVEK